MIPGSLVMYRVTSDFTVDLFLKYNLNHSFMGGNRMK